jgi:hypothetical protein
MIEPGPGVSLAAGWRPRTRSRCGSAAIVPPRLLLIGAAAAGFVRVWEPETTVFASGRLWSSPKRLNDACRKHGIALTERGEVIHDGKLVATYGLAGVALVLRGLVPTSPLVRAFDLRKVG